jgi:hypothetical protein
VKGAAEPVNQKCSIKLSADFQAWKELWEKTNQNGLGKQKALALVMTTTHNFGHCKSETNDIRPLTPCHLLGNCKTHQITQM